MEAKAPSSSVGATPSTSEALSPHTEREQPNNQAPKTPPPSLRDANSVIETIHEAPATPPSLAPSALDVPPNASSAPSALEVPPNEYDAVKGRFIRLERERVVARLVTLGLVQRHWIVGLVVLSVVTYYVPTIHEIFVTDQDGFSAPDANEPIGAIVSMLGTVYGLLFVFAFQSGRERITQVTSAVHRELSALQKIQLLAQSGALATTALSERALHTVVNYIQRQCAELQPDEWTYGNSLYEARGQRCSKTRARHRALFGLEPLHQLRELAKVAAREVRDVRAAGDDGGLSAPGDSIAAVAELRGIIGELIDARSQRLAVSMERMPLIEWVVLECGGYAFIGLLALLDTGSTLRDRWLVGVTGFLVVALNQLVADANEPLNGFFQVKQQLVKHLLEAAEEAVGVFRTDDEEEDSRQHAGGRGRKQQTMAQACPDSPRGRTATTMTSGPPSRMRRTMLSANF